MQTRLVTAFFLSSALVVATGAAAQVAPETTHTELTMNFWNPEPGATVQGVDFPSVLGIQPERFREMRVRSGGAHKFRFSTLPIKYEKTGTTINTTVTFQGVEYPISLPVNYQLKWNLYRIGYEWDFARFHYGFVGLVTEVKYNKLTAAIDAANIGAESAEVNAPIPTVGGIARIYMGQYFSATTEFTALKLTRDEFRGKFYDFDIYGQLNLVKQLGVQVGYRSLDVDYLLDADEGALKFKGTYFGGVLRF